MSTFLEIVNLARSEAGLAGADLVTLQSGLTLESQRFKTWVQREWIALQTRHEAWQFKRLSREFDTVANQASYTAQQAKATDDGLVTGVSILGNWKCDSFRISTAGASYADETIFLYMPWDNYRNLYQYGPTRAERSKPVVFSVDPQKNLWCGNVPNGAYTVSYEFYRTPQTLSADADVPIMPARFHDLLAYRALRAYGIFTSAPEVIGRADDRIAELDTALCNDQLPIMELGPPLA